MADLSLSSKTADLYEPLIRAFLNYLSERKLPVKSVTESDLKHYLRLQQCRYRKRHGGGPRDPRSWRIHHTVPIQHLLRLAQGNWPPDSPGTELLTRFQQHLIERGLQQRPEYRLPARLFADYLGEHGLDASKVQPSDVDAFLRIALTLAKRHYANRNRRPLQWNRVMRRTVHAILRMVQGEWPPGSSPSPVVKAFRQYLERHQYSYSVVSMSVAAVNQFLRHLQHEGKGPEVARPADVTAFVDEKRRQYEERHGGKPPSERTWRCKYTGPIHRMLRLVDPEWPRPEPPRSEAESLRRDLIADFARWLVDDHGLSEETRRTRCWAAEGLLSWLESKGRTTFTDLTLVEVDGYLANRLPSLRRTSRAAVCSALRSFFRFLFCCSRISINLANRVSGPHLYQDAEIPHAFTEEQIRQILQCTHEDRTPTGRRDYAMLLLLATYGLRAGEVLHLRLDDIHWREERIRIRHTKTYAETFLPLMAPVGTAILAYLENGRPKTEIRQVFLQAIAPYQIFKRGGAIRTIIHRRLKEAGIEVSGRQGAHAFRYARARSLLNASVPKAVIGNLFGHRSSKSTTVYLKLVTDDLRAIGLDLPSEERKCNPGSTKRNRS